MNFLQNIQLPEKVPLLYDDSKTYPCLIMHMVESGQRLIAYIATKDMIADALTKALLLERHAKAMGLLYTAFQHHQCRQCSGVCPSQPTIYHLKKESHYVEYVICSVVLSDQNEISNLT